MKKIISIVVLATTLLTSNVFAEGHKRHFGKQANPAKIYRKLDLSDSQKQQIKAIFRAAKPAKADRQAINAARKVQQEKRRAIIESPTFDINAANQIADEQSQKAYAKTLKMLEAEHQAWQVLTPEQQAKAKAMMEKRVERVKKRREKHREKHMKKHQKNTENPKKDNN